MVLPNGYQSMPAAEQELVVTNLERVSRGLVAYVGLDPSLNSVALAGAAAGDDPALPSGTEAGSIQASGTASVLQADYEWMYADGPGGSNEACQGSAAGGCWEHREIILGNWASFGTPIMGAAETALSGQADDPSYAELFTAGGGSDNVEFPYSAIAYPTSVVPDVVSVSTLDDTVTLEGNYFTGASSVMFGSSPATSFAVNWDGSITAVEPAGATFDGITVTTPAGSSGPISTAPVPVTSATTSTAPAPSGTSSPPACSASCAQVPLAKGAVSAVTPSAPIAVAAPAAAPAPAPAPAPSAPVQPALADTGLGQGVIVVLGVGLLLLLVGLEGRRRIRRHLPANDGAQSS